MVHKPLDLSIVGLQKLWENVAYNQYEQANHDVALPLGVWDRLESLRCHSLDLIFMATNDWFELLNCLLFASLHFSFHFNLTLQLINFFLITLTNLLSISYISIYFSLDLITL